MLSVAPMPAPEGKKEEELEDGRTEETYNENRDGDVATVGGVGEVIDPTGGTNATEEGEGASDPQVNS